MDNTNDQGMYEPFTGVIAKSATLKSIDEISDSDMRKINKLTLAPLKSDEVFAFKVIMGDNEIDDRNYEPFNLNALKDLQKLYIGKTMIKDHRRTADNQIARIYDTEIVMSDKVTKANEPYTQLVAKCYMVKTASNADLITEIKAGIKKEVSTGTVPKKAICSICGVDNMKNYCIHFHGRQYEMPDGSKRTCYFTLDGAKEAYELSFVAVPAQPRAGTTKHFIDKTDKEITIEVTETKEENTKEEIKESDDLLDLRLKALDSFLFTEQQEETENE